MNRVPIGFDLNKRSAMQHCKFSFEISRRQTRVAMLDGVKSIIVKQGNLNNIVNKLKLRPSKLGIAFCEVSKCTGARKAAPVVPAGSAVSKGPSVA